LQEAKDGEVASEQKHEGGVGFGKDEKWIGEQYNNNSQYLGMVVAWLPEADW